MTAPGTFTDRHGRTHELRLTVADLRPLKRLGFDVAVLAAGGGEAEALLFDDAVLVPACHRLARTARSLNEFAAGFDGEALDRAATAVLEALTDFFPPLPPRPARGGPDGPPDADDLWRKCLELAGACGLDPDGRTLRELWFLACGRMDLDVQNRAFWVAAFDKDKAFDERALAEMHPLRRLELPPPPEKTPEAKGQESKLGWKLIRQFFKQKPKRGK